MIFTAINRHKNGVLFTCLLVLLLAARFTTLFYYGFEFTGNDDVVFWQMAHDYAHGVFHEPFFYGQNYNFGLEPFLAVPLVWLNVPFYIGLPIISSLLGIFPFVFFAVVLFRRGFVLPSYFFLIIPLTLPIEYDILTSVSRGFTSGLAATAFLVFPLLQPTSKKSFVIFGLATAVGFVLNPNSVVFSFPIGLFLLIENYKKPAFYLLSIAVGIPFLALKYWAEQFYEINDEYIVHFMWELTYSFNLLLEGLSYLDRYFRHLTPVLWVGNWLILIVLVILGIVLLKKNQQKGVIFLATLFIALAFMGINKVNDGMKTIFLTPVRMYLSIPLILALGLFWLPIHQRFFKNAQLVVFTVAISVFLVKISVYPTVINQLTQKTNYGSVAIQPIENIEKQCTELDALLKQHTVDLVVFMPTWDRNVPEIEFLNYSCSLLLNNELNSVMNVYERRTWQFLDAKNNAHQNVLLFNHSIENIEDYRTQIDFEIISEHPRILLLKNNNKTLPELGELFNFKYQRNAYW